MGKAFLMRKGYASQQLYAPTVSIKGSALTITDNVNNGAFVSGYKLYVNGVLRAKVSKSSTVDVTTLNLGQDYALDSGVTSFSITVVAIGAGLKDSEISNAVTYSLDNVLAAPTIEILDSTLNIYDTSTLAQSFDIIVDGSVVGTVSANNVAE